MSMAQKIGIEVSISWVCRTKIIKYTRTAVIRNSVSVFWIEVVKSQKIFVSLPACLSTLIDLPPKLPGILPSFFPRQCFFRLHEPLLFLCRYLSSLISRLICVMTRYTATIENGIVPMVVKHTLFAMVVASFLFGTSFNTYIFATHVESLLLGASFSTKL